MIDFVVPADFIIAPSASTGVITISGANAGGTY